MTRTKSITMTEGPILRSLVLFAVPLILSGILQIFFNAADLAIVGNFADPSRATAATAAVGATGSFIYLIVNSVMGLSNGVNVILARAIGAKDKESSFRIVHTAILISLLSGLLVTVVGLLISPFAMSVTECPENAEKMAVDYMRIYFLGAPAIFLYNFGSAILRTKGDTRRPLNFLTVSGIANVLLNLFFVIVCRLDAAGVALATTLSQYLAAFLTIRCLYHRDDEIRFSPESLRVHKKELFGILRYGLPTGLTNMMFSFSNVQIQSAINVFKESAVAGSAASGSLEGFAFAGVTALNSATVAFAGQNIGAGNPKRTKKVILTCLLITVIFCFVVGMGIYLIGEPLYRLYVPNDEEAIRVAGIRSQIMMTTYVLLGAQNILGAATQALGYAMTITAISVVGVFGVRTLWMNLIYPMIGTLQGVYVCYPITWLLILIANTVAFLVAYRNYVKKGMLK